MASALIHLRKSMWEKEEMYLSRRRGGTVSQLSGVYLLDDSEVQIKKNATISISQKGGKSSSTIYGLEAYNNSTVEPLPYI